MDFSENEKTSLNKKNSKRKEDSVKNVKPQVYSVTELTRLIRRNLEDNYSQVWVQGEVSNFKKHSSGHCYFILKDKGAQIHVVMFKGYHSKLKFEIQDGLEVFLRGRLTVYEVRGNYQIACFQIEPVGAGALRLAFEQLKEKLQKEGLFDEKHKKPLPPFPQHVALVTSPTGAAVRDILNVLKRRFPVPQITLVPALVQGQRASRDIVVAMKKAMALKDVEVIILGRGGGSMEDLWSFNDEEVVRTVFDSSIPVVSAIGHEVDVTLVDFVADRRAATPSVAAEIVVPDRQELLKKLSLLRKSLVLSFENEISFWRQHIESLFRHLVDPRKKIQDGMQRCDELIERIQRVVMYEIDKRKEQLDIRKQLILPMKSLLRAKRSSWKNLADLLGGLSPLNVLGRGYAVVFSEGKIVKEASFLKEKEFLRVLFSKGEVQARVVKVKRKKEKDFF